MDALFNLSARFQVVTRWPGDNDPGIVESTVAQLSEYFLFTLEDVMHVVYIAVGLTILRFILDTMLFKVSVQVCIVPRLPNVSVVVTLQKNVHTDSHNPLCIQQYCLSRITANSQVGQNGDELCSKVSRECI